MPELPEVETVARGLGEHIRDARIERVECRAPRLRTPIPDRLESQMEGAVITDITRRAKYMLWQLDNDYTMLSHLGMSGRFNIYHTPPPAYKKHEHILWYLEDGRVLAYEDARRFGMVDVTESKQLDHHAWLTHLGPEPLSRSFSTPYLQRALCGRRQAIKPLLMDASLVVGVGNIYASEACFRAGIHPHMPAGELANSLPRSQQLVRAIKEVLKDAIASGGSSLRDFWHVEGGSGYFQHQFLVYGKTGKPCTTCRAPIQQSKQAGRSTFYCENCQT